MEPTKAQYDSLAQAICDILSQSGMRPEEALAVIRRLCEEMTPEPDEDEP